MNAAIESKKDEYIKLNDDRIEISRKIAKSKDESNTQKLEKQKKDMLDKMDKVSKEINNLSDN